MKYLSTIIATSILISGIIYGGKDNSLSLAELIEIAEAHNPSLNSTREELNQAYYQRLSSYSSFLPSLSLSAGWNRSDKEFLSFYNDQMLYSRDSYRAGLSLSYSVFSGGSDWLSMKYKRAAYQGKKASLSKKEAEILYDIHSAYYSLIYAQALKKNAIDAKRRAEKQMEEVNHKFELGLATQQDISKMRVQLASAKLTLVQAQNTERQAYHTLNAMLDFPLDSIYQVISIEERVDTVKSLNYFLSKMLNSPYYREIEQTYIQSKISANSAICSFFPSVNLSANYSWSDVWLITR